MNRCRFMKTLLAAAVLGLGAGAQAQDKPPMRILVGFAPGGSTDMVARLLAEKLRQPLGQTVIVENKPGAGGRLAAEALKNAAPDGQTWMLAPNATGVFQHVLYPASVLKYDLLTDLAPVAMVVSYPLALAVNSRTGVSSAKDYIAWVKAQTDSALRSIPGTGGVPLTGTPMIFVNGKQYQGALDDPQEFSQFVFTISSDAFYKTATPTPSATPSPTASKK